MLSSELSRQLGQFRVKNSMVTLPSGVSGSARPAPGTFLLDPKQAALSEEEVVQAGQGAFGELLEEDPALQNYAAFVFPQGGRPRSREFMTERKARLHDEGITALLTRLSPWLLEDVGQAVFEVSAAPLAHPP